MLKTNKEIIMIAKINLLIFMNFSNIKIIKN